MSELSQIEEEKITELAGLARSQLNLQNNPSEWTFEQREEYNQTLSNLILSNSASFSSERIAIAEDVANNPQRSLEDTGLFQSTFGRAFAFSQALIENAGEVATTAGETLTNKKLFSVLGTVATIASIAGGLWAASKLIDEIKS